MPYRVAFCYLRGRMDKNVSNILRIVCLVTFPLRGPCIHNWQWCLKVFRVLCVVRSKVWNLCCCETNVNEVGIWHIWRCPWLLYVPAIGFILNVGDLQNMLCLQICANGFSKMKSRLAWWQHCHSYWLGAIYTVRKNLARRSQGDLTIKIVEGD